MTRDHARIGLDIWTDDAIDPAYERIARENRQRRERATRDPRLALTDSKGRHLFRMTDSGNIARALKLTKRRRQEVLDRDGHACTWCGSTAWLEIDHIVRYADGGGHDLDNLRTLCHDCHATRAKKGSS